MELPAPSKRAHFATSDLTGLTWVARRLGTTEKTVRVRADSGKLPMLTRLENGSRIFSKRAIEAYLTSEQGAT